MVLDTVVMALPLLQILLKMRRFAWRLWLQFNRFWQGRALEHPTDLGSAYTEMPIAFLDFEASSFDSESFPVEVGWAVDGGDAEATLIRPAWRWKGWSASAERLHGITRALLLVEGKPHGLVAKRLTEALGTVGMMVGSDNAAFEQFWLDQLMVAASLPRPFIVIPANQLYLTEAARIAGVGAATVSLTTLVADVVAAERQRSRIRHRAGPDAEAMLWILQEVRSRAASDFNCPTDGG